MVTTIHNLETGVCQCRPPTPAKKQQINSIHKPPASFRFRSMIRNHAVTVEPFQFSPAEPVAYEGS